MLIKLPPIAKCFSNVQDSLALFTPEERKKMLKDIEDIDEMIIRDSATLVKFERKWNDKYNVDDKKDKDASHYRDKDIFDFDKGSMAKYSHDADEKNNNQYKRIEA